MTPDGVLDCLRRHERIVPGSETRRARKLPALRPPRTLNFLILRPPLQPGQMPRSASCLGAARKVSDVIVCGRLPWSTPPVLPWTGKTLIPTPVVCLSCWRENSVAPLHWGWGRASVRNREARGGLRGMHRAFLPLCSYCILWCPSSTLHVVFECPALVCLASEPLS